MKKLIVGLAAVGAVVVLRPVVKRRMVRKMREHCEQMMARFQGRGEAMDREVMAHKMRKHCEQMTTQHTARAEPVGTT